MFLCRFAGVLCLSMFAVASSSAQQANSIKFGVIVTDHSGANIKGLEQKDFTVLDGKSPKPITSFKVMNISDGPAHVIIVIDAINTKFGTASYAKQQLDGYFHSNGGHLAIPTTIATLTYSSFQFQPDFSQDGAALSAMLAKSPAGMRQGATSASGQDVDYGKALGQNTGGQGLSSGVAEDYFQKSLNAFASLTERLATIPGRKIVLWISPGWPLLNDPGSQIDPKSQKAVFENIVTLTNALREENVVMYEVFPLNPSDSPIQTYSYRDYMKGVAKQSDTNVGNIAFEVLAEHTGGIAQKATSDIPAMVAKCLADASTWYELSIDEATAEKPNEYHHIQVKVNKPGAVARTVDGYYVQQ